jgi:type II secretory ATPase GspE/PulE/Tfp pilus assembly ATPase PilB-like protein
MELGDPIEIPQDGISQKSIQRGSENVGDNENPFLPILRQWMRMKPHIIAMTEVRDKETALVTSSFVMTGHKMFATVHASNNFIALRRLGEDELDISPMLLGDPEFLTMMVNQQLIDKLCSCKVPAQGIVDTYLLAACTRFGLDHTRFRTRRPGGCPKCRGKGSLGKTLVAEMLIPNKAIRRAIQSRNIDLAEDIYRSLRTAGFNEAGTVGKTRYEHFLYKVNEGIVCVTDLARVTHPEDYEIFDVAAFQKGNVHALSGTTGVRNSMGAGR